MSRHLVYSAFASDYSRCRLFVELSEVTDCKERYRKVHKSQIVILIKYNKEIRRLPCNALRRHQDDEVYSTARLCFVDHDFP